MAGTLLRQARKRAGLSQVDLADCQARRAAASAAIARTWSPPPTSNQASVNGSNPT
jgi:hypothetical protein